MKYFVYASKQYRKAYKQVHRSGKYELLELDCVIGMLATGDVLPVKYHDHKLSGDMKDFRECHVNPNLLLVYRIIDDKLVLFLADIGSHSEIFGR